MINKYLPNNFLAEKMILNCLLINPEGCELIFKNLPVDAFYFKNHQEIYRALIFMHKNKLPIDILTLMTFLQDNGLLETIGGIKVLVELISQVPNLIYLDDYVQLVKDKFLRRSLIKLGYEAINYGYITNLPLEKTLGNFENKVFNLTNEPKVQNLFNSAELLNNIFSELKEKSFNSEIYGITSGFYGLDSITQGFQKSELIIIAGRPSTGKTALGLNILVHVIKNLRLPVLFCSLEMSKEQIMYRILSMETNITQIKLKSGKLEQNNWIKLNKIVKIFAKLPFFLDDTSNLSIQDLRSKIKTVIFEQNGIGLVIVDYLQLMENSKQKNDNRVQQLSQITRSLKILAREFNIPIIALSQLSRNVENRIDKKPILSDLRESGSIEQDADLVLMLNKNQVPNTKQLDLETNPLIDLIIAKHRNGPIGTIQLRFNEKQTKFIDIESDSKN